MFGKPIRPNRIRSIADLKQWIAPTGLRVQWCGTGLQAAVESDRTDICEMLVGAGARANGSMVAVAAEHKRPGLVHLFLEHGADPNAMSWTEGGGGPLFIAASHDDLATARILLEHSADPNLGRHESGEILWIARQGHHSEMVKLLMKFGAKDYGLR
jgi:ankyrin repeat protein